MYIFHIVKTNHKSIKDFYHFSLSLCICVRTSTCIRVHKVRRWKKLTSTLMNPSLGILENFRVMETRSLGLETHFKPWCHGEHPPAEPGQVLHTVLPLSRGFGLQLHSQFFQVGWAEILPCTQGRIFAEWKRTVFMELQWEFVTFLHEALWGPGQESNVIFSQEAHCHFCLSTAVCKEDATSVSNTTKWTSAR